MPDRRNTTLDKYGTALSKPTTWVKVAVAVVIILALGTLIGGIATWVAPGIAAAVVLLIIIAAVDQD
jgi:hypothetical protein